MTMLRGGINKIMIHKRGGRYMQEGDKKQFQFKNDEERLEIERLIACYQIASRDDRNVVWAALNKYAPKIDRLAP